MVGASLGLASRYEPIGSYVGGLTSKGQVGAIPLELQGKGWILRIASLYKTDIRQSDVRPEVGGASFQTSDGEHQHAFLYPNKVVSTIPRRASVHPFFQERSFVLQTCLLSAFCILSFYKETFRFPPSKSSDRRFCRPEPQACRPVKPCRASHRLKHGVAIFADSEQSSQPLSFLSRTGNVSYAFH